MATIFVSTGSDFFIKREKKKLVPDKMWKIVDFLAEKKTVIIINCKKNLILNFRYCKKTARFSRITTEMK
jgi:hypothetical protein